jgi:hypothetical protein
MLDVHPPHEPVHGWRDFLLHILTITIGLLIALGLEGIVEWRHHRHLVHEAETSLHNEIESNAQGLPAVLGKVHEEQAALKHDSEVLAYIIKNGKAPEHEETSVSFSIAAFDDVSWRTAQASGALAYMNYSEAQKYAELYGEQDELRDVERQAARDAIICLAAVSNADDSSPDPYRGQAAGVQEKVAIFQGQLLLVEAVLKSLDGDYKHVLASGE